VKQRERDGIIETGHPGELDCLRIVPVSVDAVGCHFPGQLILIIGGLYESAIQPPSISTD